MEQNYIFQTPHRSIGPLNTKQLQTIARKSKSSQDISRPNSAGRGLPLSQQPGDCAPIIGKPGSDMPPYHYMAIHTQQILVHRFMASLPVRSVTWGLRLRTGALILRHGCILHANNGTIVKLLRRTVPHAKQEPPGHTAA